MVKMAKLGLMLGKNWIKLLSQKKAPWVEPNKPTQRAYRFTLHYYYRMEPGLSSFVRSVPNNIYLI